MMVTNVLEPSDAIKSDTVDVGGFLPVVDTGRHILWTSYNDVVQRIAAHVEMSSQADHVAFVSLQL